MPKKLQNCTKCSIPGLYITSSDDFYTVKCPFCQFHITTMDEDDDLIYCKKCKVIFTRGCAHASNGNIYNTGVMTGYIYNQQTYKGMLVFNNDTSAQEFIQLVNENKLKATFECSCNGNEYTCEKDNRDTLPHIERLITYG